MTLKDKLADEIQSEGYKNSTDPIKLAQGIADDGTKYQRINQIYNQYKIKAETMFEAEKGNYKNIHSSFALAMNNYKINGKYIGAKNIFTDYFGLIYTPIYILFKDEKMNIYN